MSSSFIHRVRANWPTKIWLGALLTILYCAGYFLIEYQPFRPALRLPRTWLDRSVPFQPKWVWVYQSLYLLLPAAWLCDTMDQLRRYAMGFVFLASVGFTCFVLCPVAGPRPLVNQSDPMYRLLVRYDGTLNSFPSMHMALATYSACIAVAVTSGALRRILLLWLPIWVLLIGYSTIATKQHYWVDLPPGILLGWVAQRLAWKFESARFVNRSHALAKSRAE